MFEAKIVKLFVEQGIAIEFVKSSVEADVAIGFDDKCSNFNLKQVSILEYLQEKGISKKCGGYKYLEFAIKLVMDKLKEESKYNLTKDIYPAVAEKFGTTYYGASRAIENAIKRSRQSSSSVKSFIDTYVEIV